LQKEPLTMVDIVDMITMRIYSIGTGHYDFVSCNHPTAFSKLFIFLLLKRFETTTSVLMDQNF